MMRHTRDRLAAMSEQLLFVYGTLRQGSGHAMVEWLVRASEFVDAAVFQGKLFMVASYPGAVESEDPADRVLGEAYRLLRPLTLLRRLDEYERCNPHNADAPYVRRIKPVRLASGAEVAAWVYLYNRPTAGLERITSGDFLRRSGVGSRSFES